LTERGGRIPSGYVTERFAEYRDELGLPRELSPHALRHSYVTHLIEDGFDELFVQMQVGHRHASTTALYTGQRRLQEPGAASCAGCPAR
jgi:site-specific recombinase XerD